MRTAALLLLFCTPVFAADSSIEERLTRLESQVRELREENRQLREQLGVQTPVAATVTKAAPLQTAAVAAGPERELRIGGLLQAQGETGEATDSRYSDNNSRIFLRRARLNASGKFAEAFDFRAEIEMTGSLAAASSLRGQLTDAYVTWIPSPQFNIRVGQFKTPYGFEQLYSDSRLYTPERSFGSDRLTVSRQLGVSALGTIDRYTYAIGAFNGSGTNTSANDNNRFLYAGRFAGSVWKGKLGSTPAQVSAGVNGFTTFDTNLSLSSDFGFKSSFTGKRSGFGADAQAVVGPAEIWIEWLRDRFDPQSSNAGAPFDADAKSILAVYDVRPKLQLVGRYDVFDPNTGRSGSTKTWEAGVNYLVRGHDLKLQLHYVRSDANDVSHDRVIARLQTVF